MVALCVFGCASPQEKAYRAELKDYQRNHQAAIEFARTQTKQLVAASRSFHDSFHRWPKTFDELASFAVQNRLAFDPYAFNDLTLAELTDGSLQIHYDVNCSRFAAPQEPLSQSGSVNVKAN